MMPQCCALSYPTDHPVFVETVHAVSHVAQEPVRIQLIAGTSSSGRVVNRATQALQNVPGTPAAELEKVIAAGKVVEGVVVEEAKNSEKNS